MQALRGSDVHPGTLGYRPAEARPIAARRTAEDERIAARVGNAAELEGAAELAARPSVWFTELPTARRVTLGIPGARPRTADLLWSPETRHLRFGVWAPAAPHTRSHWNVPPGLRWYSVFWLPEELDGSRASVRLEPRFAVIDIPRAR